MIKIALYAIYNDEMNVTMEEIGISYIASYLRQRGYTVKLVQCHEKQFDLSEFNEFAPDIVGFTVYTRAIESLERIIFNIKSKRPNVLIAIGGTYATYNGRNMLEQNKNICCAIKGEGEATFLDLVEHVELSNYQFDEIPGLIYQSGIQIQETSNRELIQNLDDLPFPARDILIDRNIKVALLSTTRGCYSRCSFCSSQLFWKKWRGRSISNTIDEIEYIVSTYGVRLFNIIDGSFEDPDFDFQRMHDFAQAVVDRNLAISYFINLRAEAHRRLDDSFLRLLKRSGLISACIGLESGNNDDLKVYGKIAKVDDNYKIMKLFSDYDIGVSPGFINFNPYSTMERLQKNIDFLEIIGFPLKFITFLDIYANTQIYNRVLKDDLILKVDKGFYIYKYQDEKIEKISAFFYCLKDKLNGKNDKLYDRMDYYTENYHHIILYYKRLVRSDVCSQTDLYDKIQDNERQYRQVICQLNILVVKVIRQLLNIFCEGGDFAKCEEYLESIKFYFNFKIHVNSVDQIRDRVNLMLTRAGLWEYLVNN